VTGPAGWTIRPLHVGTLHRRSRNFLYLIGDDKPISVPVIMFLLECGPDRVLVDTGCADPETAAPAHRPFDRPAGQHPVAALAAIGVRPESISLVVTTHLHWDHCYGNENFPQAEFVVQRRELEYAAAPLPWHEHSYETHRAGGPVWARTKYRVLEGDTLLRPGLSVMLTPGHTPGLQSVAIATARGAYLLPSDTIPLYANWSPTAHGRPPIPNSAHVDLAAYHETFRRIAASGAAILPSHDFRVLKEARYG
jgi:N-acyl homoserine lactone hydrolase